MNIEQIEELARYAAASATDAHGAGYEPDAEMVWEFLGDCREEDDEILAELLMPMSGEFELLYAEALAGAA